MTERWYCDRDLVRELPFRYRIYALYSRLVGSRSSRRVVGGSFLLRAIRSLSRVFNLSTVVPIRGIDGLTVLADFADDRVLEVVHEIRGENAEYHVMRELLKEGDTFIDVGANFGSFSLLASRLVGVSGVVLAIEPQPRLARLIRESASRSRASNVTVHEIAAGASTETVTLLVPADDSGRAGIFPAFSGSGTHESAPVSVATLDEIAGGLVPLARTVIKIDVEGSEFAVLDGARLIIAARRPVILIELNPWSAKAAGKSTGELVELLHQLGYRSFSTTTSFPTLLDRSSIPLTGQHNLVAMG